MIVSFHPVFTGDINLLCAGRKPGREELCAIRSAAAVILPQGCSQELYEMARANCSRVFPNYDARFRYPGKTGQIRLFRETGAAHPDTEIFANLGDYHRRRTPEPFCGYPLVFKFDWGGEGETVFLAENRSELDELLRHAERCERSGQRGFLLQQFIDCGGRSLRVVVIGDRMLSYWRIAGRAGAFKASLSTGGRIDPDSDPASRREAECRVAWFCRKTRINLAGMDVIYAADAPGSPPLLLEINYFFGRSGLGGSAAYYRLLDASIRRWLVQEAISGAAGDRSVGEAL
jgi:ribosomal protein S6--L-glutamate ligase